MSTVLRTTISSIAESLGVTLKEPVYTNLATDAQRHLIEVIGDSLQLMVLTKRATLSVSDLNTAIERKWQQPLFGFSSRAPRVLSAGTVDAQDLLFYEDKQIQIAKSTEKVMFKPIPIATGFEMEWVAVAGRPVFKPEEDEVEIQDTQPSADTPMSSAKQRFDNEIELASSKHVCSHELAVFYQTVKHNLDSDDQKNREEMLFRLQHFDALQTFVPYFVSSSVKMLREARVFRKLDVALSVVRALCANRHIKFLDVYSTEMLTIGLTLLLNSSVLPNELDTQLILQNSSADLLFQIVELAFKQSYATVQPRITSELTSVVLSELTKEKTGTGIGMIEKRGALIGLIRLGLSTVSSCVIPHLGCLLDEAEQAIRNSDLEEHTNGMSLYYQELKAAGMCVHSDTYRMSAYGIYPMNVYSEQYPKLREQFGADLLPYVVDESAFMYL